MAEVMLTIRMRNDPAIELARLIGELDDDQRRRAEMLNDYGISPFRVTSDIEGSEILVGFEWISEVVDGRADA